MLVSFTKKTAVAALAVGLALAVTSVTPASAEMRHDGDFHGSGSHRSGHHDGGFQRQDSRDNRYGDRRDREYRGEYARHSEGYGCPLSPVGLITGYC